MEIFWLEYSSAVRLTLVVTLLSSAVRNIGVIADSAKDKEECAQQLTGLATCLPYVGGKAKAPTPDCCTGLKQLLKNNKKCLCVIIKDRNDPDLGLQINVTLATSLPSVCNSPANISKCPELLHLDPKSPEAQVFYQLGKNSTHSTAANSPAPSPSAGGATSANSQQKSEGYCSDNKWSGSWIIVGGVLLCSFMGTLHLYI